MTLKQEPELIFLLQTEWKQLEVSINTLLLSVEKCKGIGKKENYRFEELESFDSLTSKFNRSSDLFTQKVFRSIWILLHEPFEPFIDMMNKGEKMGIIISGDQLIEIRDLRNQIAHEYIPEAIHDLVPEVINLTPALIDNIHQCKRFLTLRNWIE